MIEHGDLDAWPWRSGEHSPTTHRYRVLELLAAGNGRADATAQHLPEAVESLRKAWLVLQRLDDNAWQGVAGALDGRTGIRARTDGGAVRSFVEAVLWVADTGASWSKLPGSYGRWRSVYVRFVRWVDDGSWSQVTTALSGHDCMEPLSILLTNYRAEKRAKAVNDMLGSDTGTHA